MDHPHSFLNCGWSYTNAWTASQVLKEKERNRPIPKVGEDHRLFFSGSRYNYCSDLCPFKFLRLRSQWQHWPMCSLLCKNIHIWWPSDVQRSLLLQGCWISKYFSMPTLSIPANDSGPIANHRHGSRLLRHAFHHLRDNVPSKKASTDVPREAWALLASLDWLYPR